MRGEGSYVYDEHGKRYLDGLSALFCVNAGHGRAELGEAAAAQAKELGFYTNWSYAHPTAIELADAHRGARARRPQPRVLHLGRLRGGRVRLEAGAPVPQAHAATRSKTKIISRETAYHGTTFGALSITGITPLRTPFEPLVPGALPRAEHERATAGPRTATRSGPPTRSST